MKKPLGSLRRIFGNGYVVLGARIMLGATFILAAAGKLPQQAKFVEVVTGYGLLPWRMAHAYSLILPWLELAVGICLVAGLLSRFAASVSILMIISFIIANGTAVFELQTEDCGCFGGLILLKTSDALLVDVVMMGIALLVLLYGGGFFSLDSLLGKKRKHQVPSILE